MKKIPKVLSNNLTSLCFRRLFTSGDVVQILVSFDFGVFGKIENGKITMPQKTELIETLLNRSSTTDLITLIAENRLSVGFFSKVDF